MKTIYKIIVLGVYQLLLIPHLFIYTVKYRSLGGAKLRLDIEHYKRHMGINYGLWLSFVYLMFSQHQFRNIFFLRMGKIWRYLFFWTPPLSTLHIFTPSSQIGGGLYIGHGWGTTINAQKIGKNFVVGQHCTIGSRNVKEPVIGDNVCIWAHCVVIGGITIGNNTNIGAGAVVVKSVPENCVVVPAKSNIIKQNGERVCIPL